MLGKFVAYNKTPFKVINQNGRNLYFLGHSQDHDYVEIEGSIEDNDFIAYFIKGKNIQAVAGQGRP